MLKSYKLENELSNQRSTVYFTKHNDREKFDESKMEEGNASKMEMSVFKKLKSDIIEVKTQVRELKQINEIYRRENYNLRN